MTGSNASGVCLCGCGQRTSIASRTRTGRGQVKGQPLRCIRGHHARLAVPVAVTEPLVGSTGLSYAEYAAINAVNWSALKHLDVSPLFYRYQLEHPREDSDTFRFGRAVHSSVLDPDRFGDEFAVWDGGMRRGRAWEEFEAANAERTILRADDYERALAVRDAVLANPDAVALLDGESEVTLTWTDAATGLPCKGRVDHIAHSGAVVDVKTAGQGIDERRIQRTVYDLAYYGQIAFYLRGAAANDYPWAQPQLIFVESQPPHDVAVVPVNSRWLVLGDRLVSDLLRRLAECRNRDRWPGRYQAPVDVDCPPWADPEPDGLGIKSGGVLV